MTLQRQLPLPLSPDVVPSYDNFYRGPNEFTVGVLQRFAGSVDDVQVYVWGGENSGKTHLLLAAHNESVTAGNRSFNISLKDSSLSVDLFDALDDYALLAIDDIDCIAGRKDWEQALFNLINFVRERTGKIIFAAGAAPASGGWVLADLESRLSWGPVLKLETLSDTNVREALMMAVEKKGLQMPDETASYLLKRHSRDVNSLLETVDLLDRESLAAGRAKITIPFLKACLEQVH